MSDDALERLKKRQRPTVKTRDASLNSETVANKLSRYQDIEISSSSDILTSEKAPWELKTKQTTFRLEVGISDRLSQLCKEKGISREVLIEAMFEYYQEDRQALELILTEAKKKADYRMEIANQKRTQSMMKRFNPR